MKAAMLLILALVFFCGCPAGQKTSRVADVSAGDYYSNDEIRGLTKGQRDRYCASLEAEIAKIRGEADSLLAAADSVRVRADSLRARNVELSTQIRDLDGEIRGLRLERRSSSIYTVKAGDTLKKISSVVFGSEARWRDIYLSNRDKIGDANEALKPGTKLRIPSK